MSLVRSAVRVVAYEGRITSMLPSCEFFLLLLLFHNAGQSSGK